MTQADLKKDVTYNVKFVSKSNTVLREQNIRFLFGYYEKDYSKVYNAFIPKKNEERCLVKDWTELELSNKKAKNFLAIIEEKHYNYNGDVVSSDTNYVRFINFNYPTGEWCDEGFFIGNCNIDGKLLKRVLTIIEDEKPTPVAKVDEKC